MTSWHGIESRLPDVMWTYITFTVWSEVIDNERYLSFLNTESLYFIPCLTTHTYLRIQCIKLLAAIVGLWMFTGSFVQGHKRSIQASNYTRESYEREQRNVAVVLIWCSCNTYTYMICRTQRLRAMKPLHYAPYIFLQPLWKRLQT